VGTVNKFDAVEQITREWAFPRNAEWGVSDCIVMADRMTELVRDVPLIDPFPNYTTPTGALRVLKKLGHAHLNDALDARLQRLPDGEAPQLGDFFAVLGDDDGPWHATALSHGGWRGLVCQPDRTWMVADIASEFRTGAVWRII
jgi:hypothetical protein